MWAATTSSGPSPVELIQQGGIAGVLIALIFGLLWARPAVDRLLADKDRMIEERAKQTEALIAETHALTSQVAKLSERIDRMEQRRETGP